MRNIHNAEWVRENVVPYFRGELEGEELRALEELLQRDSRLREEVLREREVLEILESARSSTTVLTVSELFQEAVEQGASDVHLIPGRYDLVVHFRLDGRLVESQRFGADQRYTVPDRIKVLAKLKLERRDLPQFGRIASTFDGRNYDLRVAIQPTVFGERMTIRLHRIDHQPPGLEQMSLSPGVEEAFDRLEKLPNGLVLISGPVGSGKTTLAYALLQSIFARNPGLAAMTLEDPVAYRLEGISQTEIDPSTGLTYAAALRHLFRGCDPDVVFLGDLPDRETLELAMHLAQTGHLVFVQLHATSSRTALEQLQEMGASRHKLASSLKGIVHQRLVSRVCRSCAAEFAAPPEVLERLGLSPEDAAYLKPGGCESCGGSGYRGRLPLIEVVEVSDDLRSAIQAGKPAAEFWEQLSPEGELSLPADARLKVRRRETTVEEACRVLRDYPG